MDNVVVVAVVVQLKQLVDIVIVVENVVLNR